MDALNGFNNLKLHMYVTGRIGITHLLAVNVGATQAQALAAVAEYQLVHG
jgi:hypothetical protein